ncbi:hypothetical protein [Erythrobacter sp. R86502]|uniref:hypothetical protein n=1 Tax=Erythrobacter sp. R86502 TaxID=3093846 RepID=UPI0036D2C333
MTRSALFALCLLAGACTDDASTTPTGEDSEPAGEVLPGSISDAMIPLEQLESQAPLAPRQVVPVDDIDAEQPEVMPAPGINVPPASEGAETAPAAPAPEPAE